MMLKERVAFVVTYTFILSVVFGMLIGIVGGLFALLAHVMFQVGVQSLMETAFLVVGLFILSGVVIWAFKVEGKRLDLQLKVSRQYQPVRREDGSYEVTHEA